jgi:hypothetical protein
MKFIRSILLTGLGLTSVAALALTPACGSSSSSSTPSVDGGKDSATGGDSSTSKTDSSKPKTDGTTPTTDGGADSSTPTSPGTPPSSTGPATTSTDIHNFAIHHLYLGDTAPTPAFTADTNAWKNLGYNIDGLDTTSATASGICTPYTTSSKAAVDGNNGIDNAFGESLVPTLNSLLPSIDPTAPGGLSQTVSASIESGAFTLEVDTVGLTTSATQTNTILTGQLFAGGTYGGTPPMTGTGTGAYFTQTDNWPVVGTLLQGSTVSSGSKIQFSGSYVNDGVWVSGAPTDVTIAMSLGGGTLNLTVHHAVMTFQHTIDSAGQGHATNGIISGVLETTELWTAVEAMVGALAPTDCGDLVVAKGYVYGAQDLIINSGVVTNTSGTPCNAISIGLGFDADEIAPPPTIAATSDAGAGAPCGSSGSGSGTSSGGSSSTSGGSTSTSAGSSSSSHASSSSSSH